MNPRPRQRADELDTQVRIAAFEFLAELRIEQGEAIARDVLRTGFLFRGEQVRLMGPQGIFKPQILPEMPLSFTTVPEVEGRPRPYEDELRADGLINYRYRGTDPGHHDNVGMRLAMSRKAPLVYLFGLVPGLYRPTWPVYVVGDAPERLTFTIAVDDSSFVSMSQGAASTIGETAENARRAYITTTVQKRLHQEAFRARVIGAYRESCAVCRLRHATLLDAAHILPDGHPKGAPVVANGLALCKLHHAAFDQNFIGIRPDLKMVVRPAVLREKDGPMLLHGLQDCHDRELRVIPRSPSQRPDRDALAERFEEFRRHAG